MLGDLDDFMNSLDRFDCRQSELRASLGHEPTIAQVHRYPLGVSAQLINWHSHTLQRQTSAEMD